MIKANDGIPPVLRPPDRPGQYPHLARAIAGMIRLGVRPLYRVYRSSGRIIGTLSPMGEYVVEAVEESPRFFVWISVLAALGLLAIFSLAASLVLSMEILEFSIRIPWATLVSTYAWLVVAGSGLCIINALGGVFGMHRYEIMTKRIAFLSLTAILFGLSYILVHLGRPERIAIYNVVSPNFRSAISWMGALYNIYLVVVVLEVWLLIRGDLAKRAERAEGIPKTILCLLSLKRLDDPNLGRTIKESLIGRIIYSPRLHRVLSDHRLPRFTGGVAFLTGVAALTMLGSVFAHTESRALWYGSYYPVYFIVSAIFCGFALLLTVTIITYRVRGDEMSPQLRALMFEMAQALAVVLAVGFALTAYRIFTSLDDPSMQGPVMLLLNGPFSVHFWGFEVGIMSIAPAFILLWAAGKKSLGGVLLGSVLVLIGAFVMRYQFLVGGQVYPNIKEGLPSYVPTLMEGFVIIGVFSGFLLAYSLGEKFLPLKEDPLPQSF